MAHSPHLSNLLLASLRPDKMERLLPHLKMVELPQEPVLYERGDTIGAVYFPHRGLISLVVSLASGDMIEAAMIGRDSLAGGSAAFDNPISLNLAVIQVAGAASVLDVDRFRELAAESDSFRAKLARHEQFLLAQAQQSAACNAAHSLEERLARWLLCCHDLLGSEDIALSQAFLAEMLGVGRTSVTLIANTLQTAGLIRYRRGHVQIVNLDGLRDCACECYATLKAHGDRLLGMWPEG
jgi:CRP-like cAMP-binding protein